MKILIAGARSALGSRAATLLQADGHEVIGLSGTAAGPGFVVADVLDPVATMAAVTAVEPDAIVQTLNALPKNGPGNYDDLEATARLRIEGTRNLIAAAKATGITRYVAENFFFVYGTTPVGSPPVDESYPLDNGTAETRSEDDQVRDFGGVVLRYGLFYGPGVGSTEHLAGLVRRRRAPVVRGARNQASYIHIDDAATAVVAALHNGKPGSAYNICDEKPVGVHELIREFARQLGAPAPTALPLPVLRLTGGEYLAAVLSANLTMSAAKARTELGWVPSYPTIVEGLKSVVDGRISSAV